MGAPAIGVAIGNGEGRELVTPLGAVVRFARGGVTYTVLGSMSRAIVEAVARGL